MADTVKQIGVKQQDGTYSMKDIEVDYSNVAGLSTQATSAKATADKNNKDITTYIASGSHSGSNLVLTDGAGTSSNVGLGMTGATSNANGEAGFVPQPTSADLGKFLSADGTWDTPPGEQYVGSSNISIDSNTNAIDLTNTTVSSGTYGPSADVIGNNGTTISVPNISVDAKGRITNITNKTYTSVDTGSKVFTGSLQEWEQLTTEQKKTYDFISNEEPGGILDRYPAERVSFDNSDSSLVSINVQDAIEELEANFQDGVDAVYTACAAKGSTPTSHALSDVVTAIGNIEGGGGITPTGTKNITSNGTYDVTNYASANVQVPNSNSGTYSATSRSSSIDMGATNSYRYVNTNSVPNTNSGTYSFPANDTGGTKDLGATNTYRYVNATNVYNKGKTDGAAGKVTLNISAIGSTAKVTTSGKSWTFSVVKDAYYAVSLGAGYSTGNWQEVSASFTGANVVAACSQGISSSGFGYSQGAIIYTTSTSVTFNIVSNITCDYAMTLIRLT